MWWPRPGLGFGEKGEPQHLLQLVVRGDLRWVYAGLAAQSCQRTVVAETQTNETRLLNGGSLFGAGTSMIWADPKTLKGSWRIILNVILDNY